MVASNAPPEPLPDPNGRAPQAWIVTVGASAGGLEAFRGFVAAVPPDSGLTYILVQHLDPTHPSLMVDLLAEHSPIPVLEAKDGMKVEANHIYVIPPRTFLSVANDLLTLSSPLTPQGARLPFDFLLTNVAEAYGARAAGVTLSGTGEDGAAGAVKLHKRGGLIIAQDPKEAEYDGMPAATIATGVADMVLSVGAMPEALVRHWRAIPQPVEREVAPSDEPDLNEIVELVRARSALDFRLYKPGTIRRRIERRVLLAGLAPLDFKAYLEQLKSDQAELDNLAHDLLINVTAFFRDPGIFEALAANIVPQILRDHAPDGPVRIWVAGCSTGQEAYSLGMVFLEALADQKLTCGLQIFASDIDESAVVEARQGLYPATITEEITPQRLKRFFTSETGGYRVSPELRSSVVFSVQDLLKDPPFSRLDMVSCRNLLIYFGPEAQSKAISLFHFALKPNGVLLLGGSETPAHNERRFVTLSKTDRVYRRSDEFQSQDHEVELTRGAAPKAGPVAIKASASSGADRYGALCAQAVIDTYSPPSILINAETECLYTIGELDRFLRVATGAPTRRLPDMARAPLQDALRRLIDQARTEHRKVRALVPRALDGDAAHSVAIEVTPVLHESESLALVSFTEIASASARPTEAAPDGAMQDELSSTRAQLQTAIRNLETASAEQKAVNEEALSVQEEYQSTNEELLTSKEELQSLNEELTALNTQLQETLEKQKVTSSDLQNVLFSTNIATLFLDRALKIRFYTPATRSLFNLIPSDIGRPLADLKSTVEDTSLLDDARLALETQNTAERQIEATDGEWYGRRIFPYLAMDKSINGVVITFANVTDQRRAAKAVDLARGEAERANQAKSRFLAAASHDLRQPLQTLALLQGLLAKMVTGDNARRLLSRFDETLGAMAGMLNTLLDINQIESGNVRPEISTFPVGDLLSRITEEFTYHAHAKRLTLNVVMTGLEVESDPRLLEQILRNLVSNALKYTANGKVLVGCRRQGSLLSIQVLDTGIGIAEDAHAAIFEEYHQLNNDARERSKGIGLGLSIVRRLCELLGHRITLNSIPGRGSIFCVDVPMHRTSRIQSPLKSLLPASGNQTSPSSGAILIIEDDPEIRELMSQFLTDDGHHVKAVGSGPEALELLRHGAFRPDLILADFNLPDGMDGLEASAQLNQLMHGSAQVLIVTGDISTAVQRRIEEADVLRLSKPIKTDQLSLIVQRLLDTARRPAPPPPAPLAPALPPADAAAPMIYIVDDDAMLREGLREILEADQRTVTDFASCEDFLAAYRPGPESCLLLDASLPGMSGLELLAELKTTGRSLPTIVITGHSDVSVAVQAMKAGASDFVEKPVSREDLIKGIDRALGQARDTHELSQWQADAARHIEGLTERQKQVMDMVLAGHPSKNIAADLGISQRTVENHRAAVMRRTGSRSLPALARLAVAANSSSEP